MSSLMIIAAAGLVLTFAASLPVAAQSADTLYEDVLALSDAADFPRLTGAWTLSLPGDHGGHSDARAETWSFAGHLATESGEAINLQVSLARLGLSREVGETPFEATALYRGHAIIAAETGPMHAEEKLSRGLGAAGDDVEAGVIWLDQWSLGYDGGGIALSLDIGGTPIRLQLVSGAPLSQNSEGEAPFRGYFFPRMAAVGRIGDIEVTGFVWFDHLWGEVPLPGGPLAYDRIMLHLDDGSALTILRTRRRDGAGIATLDGARIDASGSVMGFNDESVEMTVTEKWNGPNGTYPIGWRIAGAGLDLVLDPLRDDQRQDFAFPIWSGGVRVNGIVDGQAATGSGTLQLSGYEE